MSWFEWSLYARRHKLVVQRFDLVDEGHWARFRIQWADFNNVHRKKSAKKVKPTDLITLSFDKPKETKQKKRKIVTPEEVERKFGKVGKK